MKNVGLIQKNEMKSNRDRSMGSWEYFSEFSRNCSMHGLKYFGERRRHWAERAFWLTAFVTSFILCAIMILKTYHKWQTSPVIVSFDEKLTPIWKIPFPAVTICPETKSNVDTFNITKSLQSLKAADYNFDMLTIEESESFEALAQVCNGYVPSLYDDVNSTAQLNGSDVVSILKKLALPLDQIIPACGWHNKHKDCEEIFTMTITELGVCYTFNVLDFHEIFEEDVMAPDFDNINHNVSSLNWTLEQGYSNDELDVYPRRAIGTGLRSGLTLLLGVPRRDLEYICAGAVQGFKVAVHSPGEVARVSDQNFRVPMRQEMVVTVTPNMIKTAEGLTTYQPHIRQCFFNHERSLKHFQVYTQKNCEFECLVNFTLSRCNCVKFSMPRNRDKKICTRADETCYNHAENDFMAEDLKMRPQKSTSDESLCNCLPSCTSITYDVEISHGDYEDEKFTVATSDEIPDTELSHLTIFFKESQFITSKRSELYGLIDFLANCGGLLGLFLGVSTLSLIEIIYYFTLRLVYNLSN